MSKSVDDVDENSADHFELALSYSRLAEGRSESSSEGDLDQVIDRFELELGVKKPVELTRWYLLSVIRYLQQASWNDPYYSGLSAEQQEELAISFLSEAGAFRSLNSVLRKKALRYTLVNFADKAEASNFVLSNQTNAFGLAKELLLEKEREFNLTLEPIESIPGSDAPAIQPLESDGLREFTFEIRDEDEPESPADSIPLQEENGLVERTRSVSESTPNLMDFPVLESSHLGRGDEQRPVARSRRAQRRSVQTPQMPLPFAAKTAAAGQGVEPRVASSEGKFDDGVEVMDEDEFSLLEDALLNASPRQRSWLNSDSYRFSTLAGVAAGWGLFLFYLVFFV